MALLLDTVTISEFRKKADAHPSVIAWQQSVTGQKHWLSVITLNEIRYGYRKVEKRDPVFAASLQRWYQGIVANAAEVSFLPVDRLIAEQAADFRALGMSYNDALIAATAQVHGLTLATRNVSDFAQSGVTVINPWDFST
jgi:predicted nucleic acid-binding protein